MLPYAARRAGYHVFARPLRFIDTESIMLCACGNELPGSPRRLARRSVMYDIAPAMAAARQASKRAKSSDVRPAVMPASSKLASLGEFFDTPCGNSHLPVSTLIFALRKMQDGQIA